MLNGFYIGFQSAKAGDNRKARQMASPQTLSQKPGHKEEDERLTGVSKDTGRKIILDYKQTEADRSAITFSLKNNKVLSDVLQLSDQQYKIICDSVHLISIKKDLGLV